MPTRLSCVLHNLASPPKPFNTHRIRDRWIIEFRQRRSNFSSVLVTPPLRFHHFVAKNSSRNFTHVFFFFFSFSFQPRRILEREREKVFFYHEFNSSSFNFRFHWYFYDDKRDVDDFSRASITNIWISSRGYPSFTFILTRSFRP